MRASSFVKKFQNICQLERNLACMCITHHDIRLTARFAFGAPWYNHFSGDNAAALINIDESMDFSHHFGDVIPEAENVC